MKVVCYEWVCYERCLLLTWSVMKGSVRNVVIGGGRQDDRRVFSPPPGLIVSVLTSVFAIRPKK